MTSRLDAIKARAEAASHANHTTTMNYNAVYSVVWRSHQDIPALAAAVEAVLGQHEPDVFGDCDTCGSSYCGDFVPVEYPCPTVTAIQSALGETDANN